MHSLFSWPKMLGTCALLAFTPGTVIQEMSPRSDLYQSTDENAAIWVCQILPMPRHSLIIVITEVLEISIRARLGPRHCK